jgi:hypothetical protein
MRAFSSITLVALVIAGCTSVTSPLEPVTQRGSGHLRIEVHEVTTHGEQVEILFADASVTNTTGMDFYARIGDGFSGDLEQSLVFAAKNTDAAIERRATLGSWVPVTEGALVEGARFVLLRAGQRYRMHGYLTHQKGSHRIRLDYSNVNNDPSAALPYRDYSPTFVVKSSVPSPDGARVSSSAR